MEKPEQWKCHRCGNVNNDSFCDKCGKGKNKNWQCRLQSA